MSATRRLVCDADTAMWIVTEFSLLLYTARFGRMKEAAEHLRKLSRLGVTVTFDERLSAAERGGHE